MRGGGHRRQLSRLRVRGEPLTVLSLAYRHLLKEPWVHITLSLSPQMGLCAHSPGFSLNPDTSCLTLDQ